MRSPHVFLLLAIFIVSTIAIFSVQANEDPADEAKSFLEKVRAGDLEQAIREFGDNTCHCAPKGGYIAYLKYELAQDPTLAFLIGQKFVVGKPSEKRLPYNGEKYLLPWDKPEDTVVYLPLEFPDHSGPYFLPVDMAYGYPVKKAELEQFARAPEKDWWKGFTLRLRPALTVGVVPPLDPNMKDEDAEQSQADLAAKEDILPPELTRYLHPKDAAGVIEEGGKTSDPTAYAAQLPRLKSIVVGLKVVRRGMLKRWTVKKLAVDQGVLEIGDHLVPLVWPRQSPVQEKARDLTTPLPAENDGGADK